MELFSDDQTFSSEVYAPDFQKPDREQQSTALPPTSPVEGSIIPRRTLARYLSDNGGFLLAQKLCQLSYRRSRDRLLARQLETQRLRLGRSPKLSGLRNMRIGARFSAGDYLWLETIEVTGKREAPLLAIGKDVNFSDNVHVGCIQVVAIGDGVLCGSRVLITDHSHGRYKGRNQSCPNYQPARRPLFSSGPVLIGDRVWLGDGVAVLPGAEIGAGAIVGANSVVLGPIPPNCIAVGAPARPVKTWDSRAQQWIDV